MSEEEKHPWGGRERNQDRRREDCPASKPGFHRGVKFNVKSKLKSARGQKAFPLLRCRNFLHAFCFINK